MIVSGPDDAVPSSIVKNKTVKRVKQNATALIIERLVTDL